MHTALHTLPTITHVYECTNVYTWMYLQIQLIVQLKVCSAVEVRDWDGLKVQKRQFSRMENEQLEGQCRPCAEGTSHRLILIQTENHVPLPMCKRVTLIGGWRKR